MSAPDTSAEFFEAMFRGSSDPWNFAADPYEQFRYNTILRALGPGQYRHAYEPGCSVGALTEKLASICERVDACDVSPSAVMEAQARCGHFTGVAIRVGSVRESVHLGQYDLIVLSEIGYYFSSTEWRALLHGLVGRMQPGAVLLASHWLGSSPDHVLSGDEVHALMTDPRLDHEHGESHPNATRGGFRWDRWRCL